MAAELTHRLPGAWVADPELVGGTMPVDLAGMPARVEDLLAVGIARY